MKLLVTLDRECDVPVPLGDEIYFYSSQDSEMVQNSANYSDGDISNPKQHIKLKIGRVKEAEELSFLAADHSRMSVQLVNHVIDQDDDKRAKIAALWTRLRSGGKKRNAGQVYEEEEETEEGEEEMDDEERYCNVYD